MKRSANNLERHELIGLDVEITEADCPTFTGLQGKIVDETMKTFCIRTANGVKRVPKKGKFFSFHLNEFSKTIPGDAIIARPQDRTKMR